MSQIRNSVKAIIVKNGKLLTMKGIDNKGDYYLLPGGGQGFGETLQQALIRECKEEVNADVKVGELKFVRDYIAAHHEFAFVEKEVHQVEFVFICELAGEENVGVGRTPDADQIGVEWLKIDELMKHRLYPMAIREKIMNLEEEEQPVYLGNIN